MNTLPELASACVTLGKAGVQLALHGGTLVFKLSAPDAMLRTLILRHRSQLEACLEVRAAPTADAHDLFTERLAIADDLEMPTHRGSPAWLIAVGESTALSCGPTTTPVYSRYGKTSGRDPGSG